MVLEKTKARGLSIASMKFSLCQRNDDIIDALSRAGEELEKNRIVLIQEREGNYEVWVCKKA